jgi:hypothetical protein
VTETGLFTAASIPTYVASLVAPEECSGDPGGILITGLTAGTSYEVSIDGGQTYTGYTSTNIGSIQINNLAPATYTVLVKLDVCDGPAFTITVPDTSPVTYTVSGVDPTGCEDTNGQIVIDGLVAGQTYTVSVGNGMSDMDLTADATGVITVDGLPAGSYQVAVSTGGCFGDNLAVELDSPGSLAYTYGIAPPTGCGTNDGVIVLLGLTPNTEYTVDYGPVVNLTSDAAGIVTIFDLGPGMYTVTAFLGQCPGVTLTIGLGEPAPPTFTATQVDAGGTGFAVQLSGLDDFEPFTVDLGDGQPPQVYNSDANGEILITGLAAGNYSITVELEGCVSEPVEISLDDTNVLLQAEVVEPAPGSIEADPSVRLDWQTTFERQDGYFEVQRATDGRNFVTIGELLGTGNDLSAREYVFMDEAAARLGASRLYYRLRQLNRDGSYQYSDVVTVDFAAQAGEFRLLYLTLGSHYRLEEISGHGIETVALYNMNGQLVGRDTYERVPAVDLRTDHLPAGTYLVIANGTFRERLVIVR